MAENFWYDTSFQVEHRHAAVRQSQGCCQKRWQIWRRRCRQASRGAVFVRLRTMWYTSGRGKGAFVDMQIIEISFISCSSGLGRVTSRLQYKYFHSNWTNFVSLYNSLLLDCWQGFKFDCSWLKLIRAVHTRISLAKKPTFCCREKSLSSWMRKSCSLETCSPRMYHNQYWCLEVKCLQWCTCGVGACCSQKSNRHKRSIFSPVSEWLHRTGVHWEFHSFQAREWGRKGFGDRTLCGPHVVCCKSVLCCCR